MTRQYRNPNLKVGQQVRIYLEPADARGETMLQPDERLEGRIAKVVNVDIDDSITQYEYDDFDADLILDCGRMVYVDSQYLEILE